MIKTANNLIYVHADKCIGCLNCELACSAGHMGITIDEAYNMLLNGQELLPSRNRVIKKESLSAPMQCMQCEYPPCMKACPMNIIRFEDNMVKFYEQDCIGCQSCSLVCPFGAVVMAPNLKDDAPLTGMTAITCDLCGGQYNRQVCVDICPTEAITVINNDILRKIKSHRHIEQQSSTMGPGY